MIAENVKPQHIVEAERWKNINNLKQLYKLGFILEKEYQVTYYFYTKFYYHNLYFYKTI